MNILFRADSSSTIGTGHIMRDLVLAKQYSDSEIIFATQALEGNINAKIKQEGYAVEILSSYSIDKLDALIKKYEIDMIIIDHYGIDYTFEKQLSILNSKLSIMVLDDTYEKHYCHILLNHNISADEDKYKGLVPEFCELRCGSEYTLLREEFYTEKKIEREKVYDVFLAMGGVDTANLNIEILKTLPQEFKVVIVTPSVTVNEVLFIAIKTADNREDIYSYLLENGYNTLNIYNKNKFKTLMHKVIKK